MGGITSLHLAEDNKPFRVRWTRKDTTRWIWAVGYCREKVVKKQVRRI